jgi:very-short-patch-repair endonuclease
MTKFQISYSDLSKEKKIQVIQELYSEQKQSFADIASQYNTYANRIRRDAVSFGIKIRNKSEAQKNALELGKHKHPTRGTKRNESTKEKIGMSVLKSWENLSEDKIQKRKMQAKQAWDSIDQDKKENMLQKANEAVRVASKKGSKLEIYLLENLLNQGYKVEFHKEQFLVNTKLQIDLFLPTMNVAIEVDGPSHFEPVWGNDSLQKNIKYDNKKTGLILGKGLALIRIKQTKDYSKSRANLVLNKLIDQLKLIDQKFPAINNRIIEIGDNE